MRRIKQEFAIIKAVSLSTYKEWAAYKSHMAMTMFLTPAGLLVQYCIWNAVYSGVGSFHSITLAGMMQYYAVTSIIGLICFDFAEWNLQMLIRSGKLTTFLLRPITHIRYAFYQKLGHRFLSIWLEVLPVLLIIVFVLRIQLPRLNALTVLTIALGFCMTFLVNYAVGILSFWVVNNAGMRGVFYLIASVTSGVYFPLTILPKAIQNILFLLPFQFMSYVPARVWMGSYTLGSITLPVRQVVVIQFAAVALMGAACSLLWRFGEKRYMGVGV